LKRSSNFFLGLGQVILKENMGYRSLRYVPAPLIAVSIWILSSMSTLPVPEMGIRLMDKILHAVAFGILAFALSFYFPLQAWKKRPWRSALLVVLITASYGAIDEFHQSFVPGRDMSVFDWLADITGATVVMLVVALRERIRT
jgi:VanZ family protein